MTALERKTEWISAGFYVGHPALGPDLRREEQLRGLLEVLAAECRYSPPLWFHDLDAAREVARAALGTAAPQGVWVPAASIAALRREVAETPLARLFANPKATAMPKAVAAGHDVIGFGNELVLPFTREDAGSDLCRELSLPLDPPPFLPDAATARRLANTLNDDALGAPVLWVRCWRTVHAAL